MSTSRPPQTNHPVLFVRDRRRGLSELSVASGKVAHAINYLLTEQMSGGRYDVPASREAISLLCGAYKELAETERRVPERESILSRLSWFSTGKRSS